MRLSIVAVGHRMPYWASEAWNDYAKRLPPEIAIELKALKTKTRTGKNTAQCIASEEASIGSVLDGLGKKPHVVVLDERGDTVTTIQLAQRLQQWQGLGVPVALVLGGPDGFSPAFRAQVPECLRLSNLTLPHTMARVLLIEQLYRAWSINAGHPYHRE